MTPTLQAPETEAHRSQHRPRSVALFSTVVRDELGRVKSSSKHRHNLRTTTGVDWQALVMGGGAAVGSAATGTATTAPTATTATLDGVGAPGSTSAYNGRYITMGATFGIVISNTNAAPPVLTIDKWYDPTNPGGSAASTPAAGRWLLLPGNAPIQYLALTADATAAAIGDTTLASELAANGFSRAFATYSHTPGTATFTLAKTFTCSGGSTTINKEAVFVAASGAAGGDTMAFESAEPSPPTLISGDTIAQSVAISFGLAPFSLLGILTATTTVERVAGAISLALSLGIAGVARWHQRRARRIHVA